MEGLVEGRIVHYVLSEGRSKDEHRPAIIVKVWESHKAQGTVNMQVFTDGSNDGLETVFPVHDASQLGKAVPTSHVSRQVDLMVWRTSVHYSESKEPGTWHWIEKA